MAEVLSRLEEARKASALARETAQSNLSNPDKSKDGYSESIFGAITSDGENNP